MVIKVSHSCKCMHMLCFIPLSLISPWIWGRTCVYFPCPVDFNLTAYLHKAKCIPENLQDQQLDVIQVQNSELSAEFC